jgi:hypothetical protein
LVSSQLEWNSRLSAELPNPTRGRVVDETQKHDDQNEAPVSERLEESPDAAVAVELWRWNDFDGGFFCHPSLTPSVTADDCDA